MSHESGTESTSPTFAFVKRAVPLHVGAIFVVAGTIASVASIDAWRQARHFAEAAVTVRASVVGKSVESANRERSTRYIVTYRLPGRPSVERSEELPVDDWERIAEGDPIDVRHLPEHPESARARAPLPAWVNLLVAVGSAAFVAIGVLVARGPWRRLQLIRRVHASGRSADAAVIDVAPTSTRLNRVRQWQLTYEFRDGLGVVQRGTSDLLSPDEASRWQHGDRGRVLYDPARPADNVWVGKR